MPRIAIIALAFSMFLGGNLFAEDKMPDFDNLREWHTLTIINRTPYDIIEVRFQGVDSGLSMESYIEAWPIGTNEDREFPVVPIQRGVCRFNVEVLFSSGGRAARRDMDVCKSIVWWKIDAPD